MLEDKIFNDYKEAMKARDTIKSSLLGLVRAELLNVAVAKKKDKLDDNECLAVIKKQIKQHQDSIEQFNKGNRPDLADKEIKELEILKQYMPPQLPEDELMRIIEEAVVNFGSQGLKDMGKVMKEVNAKVAGQADGKLISDLVKARLSKV